MKLSEKTIKVLKNFSIINQSIYFRKGNVLRTCDTGKSIYARAEIDESFTCDFGIYDLPRFLSTLALFNDPEINTFDNYLTISSGKNTIKCVYASPDVIVYPAAKEISFPEVVDEFDITNDQLNNLNKACSVLQTTEIIFEGKDGVITVQSGTSKNPTSGTFSIEIGETDADYKIIFSPEKFNFIPATYKASLTNHGISRFVSEDVTYWMAPLTPSK